MKGGGFSDENAIFILFDDHSVFHGLERRRDLIRRDQERRAQQEALQVAITQGLESGISDRSMVEVLEQARQKAAAANAR